MTWRSSALPQPLRAWSRLLQCSHRKTVRVSLFSFSGWFQAMLPATPGLPCIVMPSLNISLSTSRLPHFYKLAFMPPPRAAITLLKGTDHLERRISDPRALLPRWQQPTYQHLWEPLFILHSCAITKSLLFLSLQEGASACPQLRWNSIARKLPRETAMSVCENTATGSSSQCCLWWKTIKNSLRDVYNQESTKIDCGKSTYCNDLHTFKKMML